MAAVTLCATGEEEIIPVKGQVWEAVPPPEVLDVAFVENFSLAIGASVVLHLLKACADLLSV